MASVLTDATNFYIFKVILVFIDNFKQSYGLDNR